MDTDELSENAYSLIVQAARGSDTLKAQLGALNRDFKTEDDWLRGVQIHLQGIIKDPMGYVEYWGLDQIEDVSAKGIRALALKLCYQTSLVLATPQKERGIRQWC